ncbi:dipeptidase [Corynebacterium pseudopelargi]|uniref:Putative succinyl-diaminopimelate desuccinylase n=1 Tax=Corynebacterium pseudopelargi TaxID=2080757 RepID=A0A3G6IS52_9CORY|nr:dipeptidase [Corynebacterium pseudopelargi]AZA08439.1 putative succinyl-diaminopimelate desuccinylase [Corynebacterium pseudopelargi]
MSHSIETIKDAIFAQRERVFEQLRQLTSYHSVHSSPADAEDHAHACEWVRDALTEAGLDVTVYPSNAPTVIGRKEAKNGAPTVLLYSHYDVVPAGDPKAWITPATELTERDGRWYARGAADCKGNLVMHLAALREVGDTDLGITFLVEGSEEMGGEELSALIQSQPELFKADVILIADSGNAEVGEPTLTTSLRGGAQITVKVDTLQAPVHSGSFGGAAPDATAALIRTLDSLKDASGAIQVDGLDTTQHFEGASYDPETFRADAGVLDGVDLLGSDNPADLVWARPAISITGFSSTPVAEAVNAVPATAQARLNLRVPPGMDARDAAEKVVEHLQAHVPWHARIECEIADVNNPFSTDISGPALTLLSKCLRAAYGAEKTTVVGSGGSIPLCSELIDVNPSAELALYGVEEPLCKIHSPNESVDPNEILHIATAEAAFLRHL